MDDIFCCLVCLYMDGDDECSCNCCDYDPDSLFPEMDSCWAGFCLFLNCLPITCGIGTVISGCCFTQNQDGCRIIIVGLLQLLTLPLFLIGWIWSICHGIELYKRRKRSYEMTGRRRSFKTHRK